MSQGRGRRARRATIWAVLVVASAWTYATADTLLVANKSDASVDLFDVASGEKLATLPTGDGPHEIAVSADGKTAVVANYGSRSAPGSTLTVIDVPGSRVTRTINLGTHERPHGVAFLDERQVAVTTEGSRSLLVVDALAGRILFSIGTGQEISHMVALAPDGTRAFVANIGSGTMTAIDLEKKTKIADVATGTEAEGIAVSPDGREVWVTNRRGGTVTILDSVSLEPVAELDAPGFPIRVAFSPDGRFALVTTPRSGDVLLFDARERTRRSAIRIAEQPVEGAGDRLFGDAFGDSPVPIGVLVTPNSRRAFVALSSADAVVALELPSGRVAQVMRTGRQPDGMAYSAEQIALRD